MHSHTSLTCCPGHRLVLRHGALWNSPSAQPHALWMCSRTKSLSSELDGGRKELVDRLFSPASLVEGPETAPWRIVLGEYAISLRLLVASFKTCLLLVLPSFLPCSLLLPLLVSWVCIFDKVTAHMHVCACRSALSEMKLEFCLPAQQKPNS